MHRFFAEPLPTDDSCFCLSPEDTKHALSVLRLKAGDPAEIISGGNLWSAVILSADHPQVVLRRLELLPSPEPSLSVTLYQGLPKSDKMDWIVQKATELGVSRIVPVMTERCVVRFSASDAAHKLTRWRKIAREACKQSGRCVIPEITDPRRLSGLPSLLAEEDRVIVPWEEAAGFGPLAFRQSCPELSSLGIIIGPEGGIDREEMAYLREQGCLPLTLGKRILRTETAGLAALSAIMSLYGEMD